MVAYKLTCVRSKKACIWQQSVQPFLTAAKDYGRLYKPLNSI